MSYCASDCHETQVAAPSPGEQSSGGFPPTRWSLVARAGRGAQPEANQALTDLCGKKRRCRAAIQPPDIVLGSHVGCRSVPARLGYSSFASLAAATASPWLVTEPSKTSCFLPATSLT